MHCVVCCAKLSLVQQQKVCKCGCVFCKKHLIVHNCVVDHKLEHRTRLQTKLARIEPSKLERI